jgi:DNA mismatch endonuclease (patch repair protein)
MTDTLSELQRSAHMGRIHAANTRPELIVRRWLHAAGYRFRLHARNLPGRPDIVLARHKTVIMVHGCFWHRHCGCRLSYRPKSRIGFWAHKFATNMARDLRQKQLLLDDGWRVIIVWECGLRGLQQTKSTLEELSRVLLSSEKGGTEIPACAPQPKKHLDRKATVRFRGNQNGKRSATRSH